MQDARELAPRLADSLAAETGTQRRGPAALAEWTTAELAARLRVHERRLPVQGLIETTFRCNLSCAHCYVNQPADSSSAHAGELPLADLQRIIDQIAAAGGLFLTFTGGEPLLRADFPDLYRHALGAGLLVSVFTNATLVTPAIADLFDAHRPEHIEVTLYGVTRATYERVTGVPGSAARAFAGLERLLEPRLNVQLKAMVLDWNADEIPAVQTLARERGLSFRFDGLLNPRADCRGGCHQELQVAAERIVALDRLIPERLAEMRRFLDGARRGEAPPSTSVYDCGAGQTTFTIDPGGRLLLCPLARRQGVDLRGTAFAEAWREIAGLRERPWSTSSPCRTCSLLPLCGSCAGANEMETGNAETPIPAFCEITHRRAAAALGSRSGHRADAGCCLPRLVSAAATTEGQ